MVYVYNVWDRYYSDTAVSLGTHNLGHLLWCLGADMEGRGHRCVHVWGGTMYRNGWTIVLECGLQDVVSNPPMYAPSQGLVSSVIIAAYVLTALNMSRDELTPRWWPTVLYLYSAVHQCCKYTAVHRCQCLYWPRWSLASLTLIYIDK